MGERSEHWVEAYARRAGATAEPEPSTEYWLSALGDTPPGTPRLFGRERECETIMAAAKAAANGRSQRLWISGAPGTGKTALCEWAAEQAQPFSIVTVACVEGESDLALGVVLSVVRSLRHYVDELPEPFRQTLRGLTEAGSSGGEPLTLATCVLALLALASERRPVMVVIDDVHWIDPTSATILGFAFRRLDADAALIILTSRSTIVGLGLGSSAEVTQLQGLSDEAAALLLEESGTTAPLVAGTIVAATGGVPLALKEIASELSEPQRLGVEPLPEPLPVGDRLLAAYQGRLALLDEQTRMAVGVAACAGSSLESIPDALSNLALGGELLATAEQARIVSVTPLGPVFPHPLLRTASLAILSPGQLRAIHGALAAASQNPLERAVHLVRSTTGPTESTAHQMESIATELSERSGAVSAAGVWLDAARMTPPGPARIARLLRAGRELASVGRISEAKQCLDEVVITSPDATIRASAVRVSTWMRVFTDDARVAAREAAEAALNVEEHSPAYASRMRATAAACFMAYGDVKDAVAITPPSLSAPEPTERVLPLEQMIFSIVVAADGRHAQAAEWLTVDRISRWTAALRHRAPGGSALAGVPIACFTLIYLERFDEAMSLAAAGSGRARSDQRPHALPQLLVAQADGLLRTGRWQEAEAVIHEAITLAQETGQTALVAVGRAFLARSLAPRGHESYQSLTKDILGPAISTRNAMADSYALLALGVGHLSTDRIEAAVVAFKRLGELLNDLGMKSPFVVPYRADHIEALIRAGDESGAREAIAEFEAEIERTGSKWAAGTYARVRALLPATDQEADTLFATALQLLTTHPFDLARTHLLWGESLRRRRQIQASRQHLDAAATMFDRLEATPWAERARRELRATGARTPRAKPSGLAELTPQEMQVAMTVADGHTNREAANRLFMSHKTVEHHLSAVYLKLGLRSRAQLVRLMTDAGQ